MYRLRFGLCVRGWTVDTRHKYCRVQIGAELGALKYGVASEAEVFLYLALDLDACRAHPDMPVSSGFYSYWLLRTAPLAATRSI